MRKILFKAKRKDNGEWVEGNYYESKMSGCYILTPKLKIRKGDGVAIEDDFLVFEIDPETLCQYIGKTDKNGRKIFERDIVGFLDITSTENGCSEHYCIEEVVWDDEEGCFHVINRLSAESWEVLDECEVLGNVFDYKEIDR